jgi:hypothetical protein
MAAAKLSDEAFSAILEAHPGLRERFAYPITVRRGWIRFKPIWDRYKSLGAMIGSSSVSGGSAIRSLSHRRLAHGPLSTMNTPCALSERMANHQIRPLPCAKPATGPHSPGLRRSCTSRRISSAASTPNIILPMSSGGIATIALAVSFRHSPNGTPGARRRTTAVTRAWNIEGASMMTAPAGGHPPSPKVSRNWGMLVAGSFIDGGQITSRRRSTTLTPGPRADGSLPRF